MSDEAPDLNPMELQSHFARGRPASSVPLRVARQLRRRMTLQEVKVRGRLRELRRAGLPARSTPGADRAGRRFTCLKERLVIEIDGGQHSADRAAAMAWTRDAALRALGFHIRRFWNADADADLGGVIENAGATFSSSPIEDRA